jgi:hypothetical protein
MTSESGEAANSRRIGVDQYSPFISVGRGEICG